jgi:glutathione S-transferase
MRRTSHRPAHRRCTVMPAPRLYDYAASCNAYKVRLLIAQLELDVERVEVDIFAGETMTAAYGALNPARTVPVLELSDGRTLPESGAILWHLAEGSPLLPADGWTRAQVMRWLLFEQADLLPATGGLRFRLQTGRWRAGSPPAQARHAAGVDVLRMLDEHLRDRAFVVGETYTIADVALYGYTHVAPEGGFELEPYPSIRAWLDRVASQPRHVPIDA